MFSLVIMLCLSHKIPDRLAGESGSEGIQGASPSNTAPHNSNNTLPDGFRLLRLAVDSLYLSYPGDLHSNVLRWLVDLKNKAQSPDPLE